LTFEIGGGIQIGSVRGLSVGRWATAFGTYRRNLVGLVCSERYLGTDSIDSAVATEIDRLIMQKLTISCDTGGTLSRLVWQVTTMQNTGTNVTQTRCCNDSMDSMKSQMCIKSTNLKRSYQIYW